MYTLSITCLIKIELLQVKSRMQNFLFPLESTAKIVTYSTADKDMLIFYILFLEKVSNIRLKIPRCMVLI